jgi:RNA-directed DNA polymerase
MLWYWVKRRHPNKSAKWRKHKYFRSSKLRNWVFATNTLNREGSPVTLELAEASKVKIQRHIKIKGDATPYDPAYDEYFMNRERLKQLRRIAAIKDNGYLPAF